MEAITFLVVFVVAIVAMSLLSYGATVGPRGWHKECYDFVVGLIEERGITKHVGYFLFRTEHQWSIDYGDVDIKAKYKESTCEWDIAIWCRSAGKILFYHDFMDTKPQEAIAYVVEKYGLIELTEVKIKQRKAREAASQKNAEDTIAKYTKVK